MPYTKNIILHSCLDEINFPVFYGNFIRLPIPIPKPPPPAPPAVTPPAATTPAV